MAAVHTEMGKKKMFEAATSERPAIKSRLLFLKETTTKREQCTECGLMELGLLCQGGNRRSSRVEERDDVGREEQGRGWQVCP